LITPIVATLGFPLILWFVAMTYKLSAAISENSWSPWACLRFLAHLAVCVVFTTIFSFIYVGNYGPYLVGLCFLSTFTLTRNLSGQQATGPGSFMETAVQELKVCAKIGALLICSGLATCLLFFVV
jgi:hypothetical protein